MSDDQTAHWAAVLAAAAIGMTPTELMSWAALLLVAVALVTLALLATARLLRPWRRSPRPGAPRHPLGGA